MSRNSTNDEFQAGDEVARGPTVVFGLTGGVGMGKTTVAQWMQRRGAALVDTDELARRVVEPGEPALREIKSRFGLAMLNRDGSLRRTDLARLVFADAAARKDLEAILHPRIRTLWQAEVAGWRSLGVPLGVVVVPLLYETKAASAFDRVLCVACSAASQRQRLEARQWPRDQIKQRIEAQWPIERKLTLADFVIWTEGSFAASEEQLDRVLALI